MYKGIYKGICKGLGYKGPCAQIVYTLGPMYLQREYFKAKVYTIRGLGLKAVKSGGILAGLRTRLV